MHVRRNYGKPMLCLRQVSAAYSVGSLTTLVSATLVLVWWCDGLSWPISAWQNSFHMWIPDDPLYL